MGAFPDEGTRPTGGSQATGAVEDWAASLVGGSGGSASAETSAPAGTASKGAPGVGGAAGGRGGGSPGSPPGRLEEPPEEFLDPISQELMLDPVLLVETGQSYDRGTIEAWFARCAEAGRPATDPLTRTALRAATLVPNYSLKSLVASWAERHRIADLPAFSKAVARERSLTASPGRGGAAAAAAAAEIAGMLAAGGGAPASAARPAVSTSSGAGGVSSAGYPELAEGRGQGGGGGGAATPAESKAQQPPVAAASAPTAPPAGARGLYPAAQQPAAPVSKRAACEAALSALRAAAAARGGAAAGAAAYHAWGLAQLAADPEGRDLLWEGNAIPLAIFLLGQPPAPQQQGGGAGGEAEGLDACKPALCATLQRMAARDADVAASIAQCGGVPALVTQLTADGGELRAAACRALYFLGWQGPEVRAAVVAALAQHAAACRLPPRPLLAFWRFWEAGAGSSGGGAPAAAAAGETTAAGREAQWAALALLLHMLAEGCSGAAAAEQLAALDAAASGVPAVLARCAAAAEAPAVRFAAAAAARTLAVLPSNLPPIAEALLCEGSRARAQLAEAAARPGDGDDGAGAAAAAGHAAGVLWELAYSPSRGGSLPGVVLAVQRQADQLLDTLEAALAPGQKPAAESCYQAAGLLACLTYEPPLHGEGAAAAAADGARALLAQPAAAGVLQSLLALTSGVVAAASPQTAALAALAAGNMAAYRGAAASPAVSPRCAPLRGGGGSGQLAGAGGSGNFAAAAAGDSGVGRLAARLAGLMRHSPGPGTASPASAASPPPTPPSAAAPTEPRAALMAAGAPQRLLRLLIGASGALQAARRTAAPPAGAATTPAARAEAAVAARAAGAAAAAQRGVLAAALQALNNLCVDAAGAAAVRSAVRSQLEVQLDVKEALGAAMADAELPPAARELARRLLQTEGGAPGQRHSLACSCPAPPQRAAAYPDP